MTKRLQRGSLRKRKSKGVWHWLASWWEDGHRRAKKLKSCAEMTKAQAQEELDKITQRINERAGTAEYTLQGYTRDIVFTWYERKWKPSTAMTTKDRVEHHLLKNLGNKPLSWFTRYNLQDFLDTTAASYRTPLRSKKRKAADQQSADAAKQEENIPLSTSTVAHLRWDLRQIFRMAVNDGLLQRSPAELLHAPARQPRPKRVLSIAELSTILAVLPVRDELIIRLAGISGLRPGEILALRWSDLHEDGLHITRAIYRGTISTPKTHQSIRTAAISKSIRDGFKAWRKLATSTEPGDWIFPNEHGNKPLSHGNYWRRHIEPVLKKLTITDVTFQALRRTAVTLLNANGADPSVIATQMGHTLDVSTNVYNRVGIQRQADAITLLDRALQSSPAQSVS